MHHRLLLLRKDLLPDLQTHTRKYLHIPPPLLSPCSRYGWPDVQVRYNKETCTAPLVHPCLHHLVRMDVRLPGESAGLTLTLTLILTLMVTG